jgi:hypothetical protein
MRHRFYKKEIPFLVLLILMVSVLAFASDNGRVKVQGRVMTVDLEQKMLVVNEKTFFWGQYTKIKNEKESPAALDNLKPQAWVYIEGEYDGVVKKVMAKKIYLLPKYIRNKERHLYPFIE